MIIPLGLHGERKGGGGDGGGYSERRRERKKDRGPQDVCKIDH